MHCGQMVARTPEASGSPKPGAPVPGPASVMGASPYAGTPAFSPPQANSKAWIWVVAACLGVLAVLGGLLASGLLGLSSEHKPDVALQANQQQPPPSLQATSQAPPPNLQATTQKIVMPDDVRKWLEHLERIEKRRMDMSNDQVAEAMQMMVALQAGGTLPMLEGLVEEGMTGEESHAPGPVEDASATAEKIRAAWKQLNVDFNNYPPPAECVPIRDAYDPVLRETGAMIGDVLAAVANAREDRSGALSALMKMRGKSKTIDQSAVDSDGLVQDICNKYETKKWFQIKADIGGGMLGKSGF